MPGEQALVAFHLCGSRFVGRLGGSILQCDISGIDSCNQLPFFHFLSFDNRQADDLSADAECQFDILHCFYNAGEVFSDY